MDYTSIEQLLTDDGFLKSYYRINEAQTDKWTRWISASQENQWLAEEAARWLARLEDIDIQEENDVSRRYSNEIWNKVSDSIMASKL